MKSVDIFHLFCTLMVLVCEELNKNRQDADPVAIERRAVTRLWLLPVLHLR